MRKALIEAEKGFLKDEVPVGSIIVYNDKLEDLKKNLFNKVVQNSFILRHPCYIIYIAIIIYDQLKKEYYFGYY